jgi:hypothetical protein
MPCAETRDQFSIFQNRQDRYTSNTNKAGVKGRDSPKQIGSKP